MDKKGTNDNKVINILIILGCLSIFLIILFIFCNEKHDKNTKMNQHKNYITKNLEPNNFYSIKKQKNNGTRQNKKMYQHKNYITKNLEPNNFDINYGVQLKSQKDIVDSYWKYSWGPEPWNNSSGDKVGVLQIVNGGNQTMWINYGGIGIDDTKDTKIDYPVDYRWRQFIETPSELNNNVKYKVVKRTEGQGLTFKLEPNQYQIVPFTGTAAWISGSLGCCEDGTKCIINPQGRAAQTTLFEWTVPGVWDGSAVDGFHIPIKFEIDGCDGTTNSCNGSEGKIQLKFTKKDCVNPVYKDDGVYLGCKSTCACQYDSKGCLGFKPAPDNPLVKQCQGYCGTSADGCVAYERELYGIPDSAAKKYCDSITKMTSKENTESGTRTIYCQAYDDLSGTKSLGNGVIKVTMFNTDFDIPPQNCSSPPSSTTYACTNGNCVVDSTGKFKTLQECEDNCSSPPSSTTYACTNGNCVVDSTGKYKTKQDCEVRCCSVKYKCTDSNCVVDSTGTYKTLTECQSNCSTSSTRCSDLCNKSSAQNCKATCTQNHQCFDNQAGVCSGNTQQQCPKSMTWCTL